MNTGMKPTKTSCQEFSHCSFAGVDDFLTKFLSPALLAQFKIFFKQAQNINYPFQGA
jgi:hypothetical protein